MKQGNRRSEHLLREAELWSATAAVRGLLDYPADELERLWKTVLLHQFHDILPGSSIAWVHREARATYAGSRPSSRRSSSAALDALARLTAIDDVVFNAGPVARDGVPAMGGGFEARKPHLNHRTSRWLRCEERQRRASNHRASSRTSTSASSWTSGGVIRSVLDKAPEREVLPPGGAANLLQLHPDHPVKWDAWDLDRSYRAGSPTSTEATRSTSPTECVGDPQLRRTPAATSRIRLVGDRARDRDRGRLARAGAGPQGGLRRRRAHRRGAATRRSSGTWSGRPTRTPPGTPPASRSARTGGCTWARAATASRSPTTRPTATTSRGTPARAAARSRGSGSRCCARRCSPTPETDQGRHVFRYALVPGATVADAAEAGYALNLPLRRRTGAAVEPLVRVDGDGVRRGGQARHRRLGRRRGPALRAARCARLGPGHGVVRPRRGHRGRPAGAADTTRARWDGETAAAAPVPDRHAAVRRG